MGWLMGLGATALYLATMEPDASFWDCGEFIAIAYGFQVGHPPGAPFYQLLAHLFMLLAGDDPTRLAWWSNALSAVAGGVAVMMLFWSLAMLLRKSKHAVLGAVAGAACYMVCDTAWFSATESEVYSLSMALSSTMVWAMLRWATDENRQRAGRWILLTALLMGLSVCVHQLSLLTSPALLLIYLTAGHREWRQLKKLVPMGLLLFAVGLTPYLMVPINAKANPPINQGHPKTWKAFKRYVNREQYAKAPLLPRVWRERDKVHAQAWSSRGGEWEYWASYQVWYMYGRYLMWNFAGRYNDRQGMGTMTNGQCITGIPWIDIPVVGTSAKMPESLPVEAHNRYFLLPLLLGLIGMVAYGKQSRRGLWVVMALFLMGGLVLNLYLNHPCYEPRERDYAYVLSFYAFAMFIGAGVAVVSQKMGRFLPYALLAVPLLMAWQNLDDHDRSGRHTAADTAHNLLNNCEHGALLVTAGDNDTFPLWYAQQVERYRTDVRVENLALKGGAQKMMLLLAETDDATPIYLTHYAYNALSPYLEGCLGLAGNVYRLDWDGCDPVLDEEAYDHVMNDLGWRDTRNVYVDPVSCSFMEQYWKDLLSIAETLIEKGDKYRAHEVLLKGMEIPLEKTQDPQIGWRLVKSLAACGDPAWLQCKESLSNRLDAELAYFNTIAPKRLQYIDYLVGPRRSVADSLANFSQVNTIKQK